MNYTLDLAAGLTQVLADDANIYLYGNGRISQSQITNPQSPEYFLGDALGSVRQLADTTGAVTLTQSYAPYGDVVSSVGTSQTSYAFTGEALDANGLSFLRARYYAPQDGRFVSRDIWRGDHKRPVTLNGWQYAYSNPIRYSDPSGQDPWWCAESSDPAECFEQWRRRCEPPETTTSVFFVCGFGVGNCKTDFLEDYGNTLIFGDVVRWAIRKGYTTKFYESNSGGAKLTVANEIKSDIEKIVNKDPSSSSTIFLLGHSAGADSAVYGTYLYASGGGSYSNIGGIALLDSYLNIPGVGNGNIINEADQVDNNVPFWGGYSHDGALGELDFGSRLNKEFEGYKFPYTTTHTDLAVNAKAQAAIIAYFESRR